MRARSCGCPLSLAWSRAVAFGLAFGVAVTPVERAHARSRDDDADRAAAPPAHAHGRAAASSTSAATSAATTGPRAEVRVGTAIEHHGVRGEATAFHAGGTVYVWSNVLDAEGKHVEHLWRRDGRDVHRAHVPIRAARWRTSSKMRAILPGAYVVEVLADEAKIGEVSFAVK